MSTKKLQIIDKLVNVDETLKQSGVPADAKATGDELARLDNDVLTHTHIPSSVGGIPIVTATSTDGYEYTATVEGITELYAGLALTIIPDTTSTMGGAMLNVNGLGSKNLRMQLSNKTGANTASENVDWIMANRALPVMYDGAVWKTYITKPHAGSLVGAVAIANGGTGATTAEDALVNLGALSNSGGTITGTLHINNTTDASSTADNNAALIIGNRNGEHIVFDGNEILPKSGADAGGTLYLGDSEDTVISISGAFRVNSYSYGDSLPSAGIAGRVFFKKVT